jgi:hypothetical protein
MYLSGYINLTQRNGLRHVEDLNVPIPIEKSASVFPHSRLNGVLVADALF